MAVNHFESIFILTPVLSEQQMKETVDRYRALLKDGGAKMIHEENWGLRKLAYPILQKSTGFYQLFEFQAEGSFINKLETEFNRDEAVLRFLSVKLDKYGVEFNERRRKKKGKETPKTEEVA